MAQIIYPSGPFNGVVTPPGDKSISHRALILNAIADGTARISSILRGEDVLATLNILRQLGVIIEDDGDDIVVHGVTAFSQPVCHLDCGNSGTTMRLLLGLLAASPIITTFVGDASLSKRPMRRVTRYLKDFGVSCEGKSDANFAPITIQGNSAIEQFEIAIPMASAQVKSALALVALRSSGGVIRGGKNSRDHTERMIRAMGADCISHSNGDIEVSAGQLRSLDIVIPGDFSSAAFVIVAALITPGSRVLLRNVNINETRIGLLTTLLEMNANIDLIDRRIVGAEPVADLSVSYSTLQGVAVPEERIATMIDEIPILAVAASQANGKTVVTGASELRKKESDRLESIYRLLSSLGGNIVLSEDGFVLEGPQNLYGGTVDCQHDHRIAMSTVVAAAVASSKVTLFGEDCIATSFPYFWEVMKRLGLQHHED